MSRRLLNVRTLVALGFAVTALASLKLGIDPVLGKLHYSEQTYGLMTPAAAEGFAAASLQLDDRAYLFFQGRVTGHDRFYFQEPADRSRIDPQGAAAAYAQYRLVPAVLVTDPARATVVLSYGADPRSLGLAYSDVQTLTDRWRFSVARVRR